MDRSVDVIAPLLHEFSYQAMISDFIGIEEGNKIRWEGDGSVNGFVTLDESDPIWVKYSRTSDSLGTHIFNIISRRSLIIVRYSSHSRGRGC